jgi:DNA-binding response OmpR family regulator
MCDIVQTARVTAVGSLAEALHKVREGNIDLLVTDYHLNDGETGTQVIAALRQTWVSLKSRADDWGYVYGGTRSAP